MFLLYHRSTRPTGRVLAAALGIKSGEEVPYGERDTVIRWGSRVHISGSNRVLNSANAIATASDKLLSLRVLDEAGVRVPRWSTDPEQLSLPVLGRRSQHTRGTDIVLCLQRGDWSRQPRDYYTEYIPTVREFRVHVLEGEVIRVQGKYLDEPGLAKAWLRNHASGYRFRAPRKKLRDERLNLAIRAVEALGLDFGAVDLLIGDDGETYVLEVNTAPACAPLTAEAYVRSFAHALSVPENQLNLRALRALSVTEEGTEDE